MAFAPGGLEERQAGDDIEFVLYGAAGELPALGDVRAVVGDALVDVSTSEVAGRRLALVPRADRRRTAAGPAAVGAGRATARSTS